MTLDQDTVWLDHAQMGQNLDAIPENVLQTILREILQDEELEELATSKEFLVVARKASGRFPYRF